MSVFAISVSAAACGIAEADSIGMVANAQAATPINNSRFILNIPLEAAESRRQNFGAALRFAFNIGGNDECHHRLLQPPRQVLPHPPPPRSSRTRRSSNTAPTVALTIALMMPMPRWTPS
jgi:hypothetical protein